MGLFSDLNKSFESPFKVQIPSDVEFCKLADLDINASYRLVSCYINSKSKFGAHPVAGVIDNDGILLVVSLPRHLTGIFENILEEPKYIEAINAGECNFKIKQCHSNKYNKDFLTIEFIDWFTAGWGGGYITALF